MYFGLIWGFLRVKPSIENPRFWVGEFFLVILLIYMLPKIPVRFVREFVPGSTLFRIDYVNIFRKIGQSNFELSRKKLIFGYFGP